MDNVPNSRLPVQNKGLDIFPVCFYRYLIQAVPDEFFCNHRQLHIPVHLPGCFVFRKELPEKPHQPITFAADVIGIPSGNQGNVVVVVRRHGYNLSAFDLPQKAKVFGMPVHIVADGVHPDNFQILLCQFGRNGGNGFETVAVILVFPHQ